MELIHSKKLSGAGLDGCGWKKIEELRPIYENLVQYNFVYRLFNDERVFQFSVSKIQELIVAPPDIINTLLDDIWANPYAVLRFYPNLDIATYLHGCNTMDFILVRQYIEEEDPICLLWKNTTKDVLQLLERSHLFKQSKDIFIPCDTKWYRKQSFTTDVKYIVDMDPSFSLYNFLFFKNNVHLLDCKTKYKPQVVHLSCTPANIYQHVSENSISIMVDMNQTLLTHPNVFYWSQKALTKIKHSIHIDTIVFLFNKEVTLHKFTRMKHFVYTNVNRIEGLCYAITEMISNSKHTQRQFTFKTILLI
jgi:hypothetical protein